ncbi:hypothetical protein [Streptacidiphilus carbonis]|uniref:hypothetical protein n=1 Tax=Streptacidiphilus carbonis TaxID=105422 RepID=UPI0005A880BE|nr:hypothetical protein [Streptacidiphilus carbonis]
MELLLVLIGLLVLVAGTVVGVAALAVVKTKRAVVKAAPQARRAVEDVGIKARSLTRGGVQGQVSALRAEVRGALAASRRVLEAGSADDPQLVDAMALLGRLEGHASVLDGELRLLEREPEPGRVEARFAVAKERGERIVHLASSLRWAAQDRLHRFADEDLLRLGEECEAEAGALRHWAPVEDATAKRLPG